MGNMTSPTRQAAIDLLERIARGVDSYAVTDVAVKLLDALTTHFLSEAEGAKKTSGNAHAYNDCPQPVPQGRVDQGSDGGGDYEHTTPARGPEEAGTISPASLKDSPSAKSAKPTGTWHYRSGPMGEVACTCSIGRDHPETIRVEDSSSAKGDEELGRIAYESMRVSQGADRDRASREWPEMLSIEHWIRAASAVRAAVEEGMRTGPNAWCNGCQSATCAHAAELRVIRDERDAALARVDTLAKELAETTELARDMSDKNGALSRSHASLDRQLTAAIARADQAEARAIEMAEAYDSAQYRIAELEAELAEARVATEARLEMRQQIAADEMRERAAATIRRRLNGLVSDVTLESIEQEIRALPLTAPPAPAAEKTAPLVHYRPDWEGSIACGQHGISSNVHRDVTCPECVSPNSTPARGERWGVWCTPHKGEGSWVDKQLTHEQARSMAARLQRREPGAPDDASYSVRPLPAAPDDAKETAKEGA